MKRIFLLFLFSAIILCSKIAHAQINYEASYYPSLVVMPQLKYFNHMSAKWFLFDYSTIKLYNLDHSLFRTIVIPPQSLPSFGIYYLTEDLFDNDSTNIEYIVATAIGTYNYVKVYRENGALLFQRDSANANVLNIAASDSGTKMILGIYTPSFSHFEIYSLPGKLPCPILCGGASAGELAHAGIQEHQDQKSTLPYPNPSSSQIHIPYQLPQGETTGEIVFYDLTGAEMKRYKVDKTFSELILSTADLAAGSYYYQLQTPHSKSEGKKLVVIE